jgi:hypothetical protein
MHMISHGARMLEIIWCSESQHVDSEVYQPALPPPGAPVSVTVQICTTQAAAQPGSDNEKCSHI